jgi:Ca2+-binding RTX toxin-like protein
LGGNDQLSGLGGNDTLLGGSGGDTMLGGSGTDTVTYEGRATGVFADTDGATGDDGSGFDGPPGARDTIGADVENLIGGNGSDTLTGWSLSFAPAVNNRLEGGPGNDILRGYKGDDLLIGGVGADTLQGGTGADTVTYADHDAPVRLYLGGAGGWGGSVSDGVVGGDTSSGDHFDSEVEVVICTAFNDEVSGSGPALISAGAGADTLTGGPGNDHFYGDAGEDNIDGRKGDDFLFGGDGDDTIDGLSPGRPSNVGHPSYYSFDDVSGNDYVFGEAGADYLIGNSEADHIQPGAGDDYCETWHDTFDLGWLQGSSDC